jgi:hypothetical protein
MRSLDYSVMNTWLIDIMRAVALVLGGVIFTSCMFFLRDWRRLDMRLPQKFRFLSLLLYALMSVVQELDQLGRPMVVWRLPLIIVAGSCGIYGLYGEAWSQFFVPRSGRPVRRFEWPEPKSSSNDVNDRSPDA